MNESTSSRPKRPRRKAAATRSTASSRRVVPKRANGRAHDGLLDKVHPAWLVAGGLIAAGVVARIVMSRGLLGGLGLAAAASGLLAQLRDTDWAKEARAIAGRVGSHV